MKPRKPPNHGRNGPGVMGRPRVDQELLARAVAMVEAGSHTCEEAGEEIGRLTGTRLGGNTVRRAVKAKEAAAEGVIVEAGEPSAALSADRVDDVLSPADPERAAAIRSLVVRGTLPGTNAKGEQVELPVDFGPDWIARVAEGEGITAGEVRRLLREAAVQARLDALPFELARERSIAVADGAGQMAKDAHDWKSLLLAQAHVDRLRFLATPPDPEGLTRAEVTILLRRVAAELQEVAGGVEALQRALAGA